MSEVSTPQRLAAEVIGTAFLLATVWALRAGRRDRNGRVKAG